MTKSLPQSVAVSMIAVLAISAFAAVFATNSASATPGFLVTLTSTQRDVLDGDNLGWILTIANNTGKTQTNVNVKKHITENAEGFEYIAGSGFMQITNADGTKEPEEQMSDEWGKTKALIEPFYLEDGESLRVEWNNSITGKVSNDWIQTSVFVTTDELKNIPAAYKNTYVVPSGIEFDKSFTVAQDASSVTVNPGGTIDYTITMVNNGEVILDDVTVNLGLPNGDSKWVNYIPGSGSFNIDGVREVQIEDKWAERNGRFTLDYLNPGKVLTINYSVRVYEDAPHGLTLNSVVNARAAGSTEWTQAASNTTVVVEGVETPVTIPGSTPAQLPETGGLSTAAMALWLTAATGLTGAAFQSGRKMILG